MDVSSIANASVALDNAQLSASIDILMLKKVLDMEAQHAQLLLEALPPIPATNPPNLGNGVDTFV